jgi:hypothetical protein
MHIHFQVVAAKTKRNKFMTIAITENIIDLIFAVFDGVIRQFR